MLHSTRFAIGVAAILILFRFAAGSSVLSNSTSSNASEGSRSTEDRLSQIGPTGDCQGKIFFLYPVFKKVQIVPGAKQLAFEGLDRVRSAIVLVSDRFFLFEMHGQRYEPEMGQAPLPTGAYVVMEWESETSLSAESPSGSKSRLPIPAHGFPIDDETRAERVAAEPLGSAQCRIVQSGGFLPDDFENETVFGATVSVEPHTRLTILAPATTDPSDRKPRTVWISLVAAWEYRTED